MQQSAMKGNKGTYLLLAALFFCSSLALYEDEIGLNDWYIQGLGRINHIGFGLQGQKNRIIVSTEENVIASLKLNSDLEWRQPISEQITDLQVHPGVIVATTDKSTFAFNHEGSFLWRESESVLDSAALALKVEGTFTALVTQHHVKILGADGSLVWESKQPSVKLSAVSARHDTRQFIVLGQSAKGPVVLEIKVEDKKTINAQTVDLTNGPAEAITSAVQTEDYTFFTTSRTDAVYWFKKGTTAVKSHNVKRVDQLRDIDLSNGVAVTSQDAVSVLQVKGDTLTVAHDFQKTVTMSNAAASGDVKYIAAYDGDSLIVVQLGSTVQVNKHQHKAETGAAIQHLALTAQAGSAPLLILSAADGTAHALELSAKPSPRWALNTPSAVKSAHIVDCAPRPRDTATQSLLDLSAIQQYFDFNAIQKAIMDLIQPAPTRRERVPEREEDLLIKDEFGFKKVIIAITEYSSIYAIHSSGGRVLWRQYVPDVELQQVYVIKKAIHYPPEVVIVGTNTKTSRGFLRHLNPHTGQIIRDVHLTYDLDQVVQLPFHDKEYRSVLLLVDDKKNVNIYPDTEETRGLVHENREHIFFYQVDEKAGSVTGYTVPSNQGETAAVPVWQKLFGAHRHVAVAHNQVNIYQSARPGSVLTQKYFYLNPNLLALAVVDTEESDGEEELDLLLIDTVTGQLLHQVHHSAAQGPINIVAKDYWVAYQYWNSKTQQHEISVIEMYYNDDDRAQHTFSSHDQEDVYPDTFESQSYINPRGVRVMQPTATHYGITNTHVLLGLENGQIYSLDKRFLDSRRVPANDMKQEDKDRGILPYMPILPYNPRQYVSYSRTVQNLSGIVTSPTLLESTSVMLAYGTDLFFVPVAPSRTYDRLSPDFSYGVLIGVVAIIVVLTFFVQGVAKKRELNKKWQ